MHDLKSPKVVWWKAEVFDMQYSTERNVVGTGLLHHVALRGLQSSMSRVEILRGEKRTKLLRQFQSRPEARELTRSWQYPDGKEMKLKGDTFYRPKLNREEVSNYSSQSL